MLNASFLLDIFITLAVLHGVCVLRVVVEGTQGLFSRHFDTPQSVVRFARFGIHTARLTNAVTGHGCQVG